MDIKFRPMQGSDRTYYVIVTRIGVVGITHPGPDGKGWVPVTLAKGVRTPGRQRTRQDAGTALAQAMATRVVSRSGRRRNRNRKVVN